MKSMFDACCTVQQPVNAQQGGQQPTQAPGMQATTASTATNGTTSNVPPRHGQGVSNLLTKVEEKVPMVAPFTSSIRSAIPNATPAVGTQVGKLDSNVIGGQGEETRSFGEVIRNKHLPIVAIFPANSKTGLSTLRALTGYPNRNTCAKIQCIVRDEAAISMVRGELNEHLTDSVSFSFADYTDPQMMATAFMGVDRLMIIPPNTQNRAELVCNGIQAAKLAGVPHVVLMSAIPAQHPGTMFGKQFRRMEECLEGMRGYMNFTIMRMAWFMDNFLDMAADIVSNNRFLSSWGPSSVSAVSLADIGRSAAAVLSSPKDVSIHYNRMYHLTGPESLSGFRMAEIFSKVLGRQIAYQDLPREEMRKVYADGMHLEAWQADGYVEMNELFKSGAAAAYSTDVAMLTQGNHTTFERFVRNKRWYFAGQRSPLICILPASGRVGTNTLAALMRDKSHGRIRAVVRGADHKAELENKFPNQTRLEVVNGDFEDISSLKTVLEGVDSLLIIPPEKLERFSLIDEAIRGAYNAGVGHTILFSVAKAFDATALGRKFNAWERVLEQNSYSFTIVQSTLFQDLMFHFAEQVKQPEHRIHHWLGNGRFCPVDARDVGEACAAILREGPIEHHGHIYELTGPQALNVSEMTQILSKVLGYPIEAVPDITSEQVRATLQGKLPSFNVEEVIQAHETVANGSDTVVKPDLIKLTGHAKTIQAFFEDFRSRFEGRPSAGYGGYDQQKVTVVETKTVVPSTATTATTPSTQQPSTTEYQKQEEPSTTEQVPKAVEPQQNVEATKMAEATPSNVSVQVNVAQT